MASKKDDDVVWPDALATPAPAANAPRVIPPPAERFPDALPAAPPVAGAPPPPDPLTLEGFLHNLASGTSAAVHGVAGIPGAAYDLAASPFNLLSAGVNKLAGTNLPSIPPARDQVSKILQTVGLPPEGDQGVTSDVIEGLGGVLGGAGIAGGVRSVMGVPALLRRPLVDQVTRAMVTKPVVQVASGVGAGAGTNLTKDSQYAIVRALGPLAGGFAGAVGGGAASRVGGLLAGTERAVDSQAARALLEGAADKQGAASKILSYSADDGGPLGGMQTTAEIAGDPGLFQTERTLRSGPSSLAGDFVTKDSQRQVARREALDEIAPPGGPSAAEVAVELRRQQAARDAVAAERDVALQLQAQGGRGMTDLTGDLEAARTRLGAGAEPEQAGPVIREQLTQAQRASSDRVGQLGGAVDPDNSTAIATRPIREAIIAQAEREYGADPALRPAAVNDMLARLADERVSFNELQHMRSSLLRQSQGFSRSADPSLGAVRAAGADAIRSQIENAAATGDGFSQGQLGRWEAFRDAARRHGEQFGSDPALDITASRYGRPDLGSGEVAGQFFQPGEKGITGAQQFRQVFTNEAGALDPTAMAAMRQYIVGKVAQFTGPDGAVDAPALARFVNQHAGFLRQFPELQQDLRSVRAAQQAIDRANVTRSPTVPEAADKAAGLFLERDPQQAVRGALASQNPGQALVSLRQQVAVSPQATEGLRRAIIDDFENFTRGTSPANASGPELVQSLHRGETWFQRYSSALSMSGLFSPEELQRMDLVRRDLLSGRRVSTVGKAIGSNTMQQLTNGQALDLILSGAPVPSGFAPLAQAALQTTLGNRFVAALMRHGSDKIRSRLYQAALDPESAQLMLRNADPVAMDRLLGRLEGADYGGMTGRIAPGAASGTQQERSLRPVYDESGNQIGLVERGWEGVLSPGQHVR